MRVKPARVGIVSFANDLHALAVQHRLQREGAECYYIEADKIAGQRGLNWPLSPQVNTTLLLGTGERIDPSSMDAVWWRRFHQPQKVASQVQNERVRDVVNNDCQAALVGVLLTRFGGA